jgi:hypothetical protein
MMMMEHIEFIISVKISISQLLRWSRILNSFVKQLWEHNSCVHLFFEDHHEKDNWLNHNKNWVIQFLGLRAFWTAHICMCILV